MVLSSSHPTRKLDPTDADLAGMSARDVQKFAHELQICHEELKIQNEELRNAQTELSHSRDMYADLYDFAPVGYVTLDRKGIIENANLTAGKMLGMARQELINSRFSQFIAEESQDEWHRHRRHVFIGKVMGTCELEMKHSEGQPLFIQLQSTAFRDEFDGGVDQWRAAMIDVTELKLAEQWRIEAERLFQMTENLPAGAVYVDREKLLLNQAAEEITGYRRDEMQTVDDWFAKLYPNSVDASRKVYEKLRSEFFRDRSPAVSIVRKDGGERIVEFAAHRVNDHEIWLIYDLTHRAHEEQNQRRAQFALDHVAEAVLWARPDGGILYANDAASSVFGYDHEALRNCFVAELDAKLTSDKWPDLWNQLKNEKHARFERELKNSRGETFTAELVASYLEFHGEEFVCGIIRDHSGIPGLRPRS